MRSYEICIDCVMHFFFLHACVAPSVSVRIVGMFANFDCVACNDIFPPSMLCFLSCMFH